MLNEKSTRQALSTGLAAYERALSDGAPELEIQRMVIELDALVPHGGLSDLLFWGECERSTDEIIDEAIRREKLWLEEGELALLIYKESKMRRALDDPHLPAWARNYIDSELPVLMAKIASFGGSQVH